MWVVVVVFSATWWVWETQAWVKTEIISEFLAMEDVCMVTDRNEGGHIVFTPRLAEDEGVTQGLGSDKKGARILTH